MISHWVGRCSLVPPHRTSKSSSTCGAGSETSWRSVLPICPTMSPNTHVSEKEGHLFSFCLAHVFVSIADCEHRVICSTHADVQENEDDDIENIKLDNLQKSPGYASGIYSQSITFAQCNHLGGNGSCCINLNIPLLQCQEGIDELVGMWATIRGRCTCPRGSGQTSIYSQDVKATQPLNLDTPLPSRRIQPSSSTQAFLDAVAGSSLRSLVSGDKVDPVSSKQMYNHFQLLFCLGLWI